METCPFVLSCERKEDKIRSGNTRKGLPMERKIKVKDTNGYKYQSVPTLQLKGKYLNDFGFPINTPVSVVLEQEKITIIPVKQIVTE